ncbi:MAG: CHAD domain-containing protein [Sphingobium sp.]|nr:CHAD domain-containing protein [Sphingobium sp.]
MPTEVELKLELDSPAADFLEASPLLEGKTSRADQRAIYFDTADHLLFRHGLSLRIRRTGRKRIQTIKADGGASAGLFDRREWEMPVTSDAPVPDDRSPIPALLAEAGASVGPIFEVRVQRRSGLIEQEDARIELVVDRGAIMVGERQAPVCEIELELKSGAPQAMFDLARRIDAIVPVRLGALSKSERGYRLLEPASRSFKAEPVTLDPAMTTAQAFQTIAHNCLRHYRLNEALLLSAREPAALHQARVAIRRLRSAFSIFKALFADPQAAHFRGELKWLAALLGGARDLDVIGEKMMAQDALHDRIETARGLAYDAVEAALAAERVRALMLDLAQWLAIGGWLTAPETTANRTMPIEDFAGHTLSRLRRRVKKDGRHIERLEDEARHEVRKDAKKLRYTTEFMGALFREKPQRRRQRKFLSALEGLQDRLGALNDLATMPNVLSDLGLSPDEEARGMAGLDRKPGLLAGAARAHDALIAARKFWA